MKKMLNFNDLISAVKDFFKEKNRYGKRRKSAFISIIQCSQWTVLNESTKYYKKAKISVTL